MNTPNELIIDWSQADDFFLVEVPELAGRMADGQTQAEVIIDE